MNNLISIIVPVYNVEKYLKTCIDSILKQTYETLEIILVNDGSTDNSGNICDEYSKKDNRIRVIHKENGGLSDARNKGIDNSNGKYITFIDSDDYIHKDYILLLYNAIKDNNVKISQCGIIKVDSSGNELEKIQIDKNTVITGKQMLEELNTKGRWDNIVTWNKIYDITLFNEIRFPKGKIHEDEFTTYKLLYDLDRIAIINNALYYYRQNNDSITGKKYNVKRLDAITALQERMEFYKLNNEEKLYNLTVGSYLYNIQYAYMNLEGNKEIKRKLVKTYKEQYNKIKSNGKLTLKQKIKHALFIYFPKSFNILNKISIKLKSRNRQKEMLKFKKKFQIYTKKQREKNDNLYLLFNGPNHGNLGDHAILFAEENYLREQKKEPLCISANEMISFFDLKLQNEVKKTDNIYITGGGYLGTLWLNEQQRVNKILHIFKENKIEIFPQTIYYSEDEAGKEYLENDFKFYNACKDLTIYCRDKQSLDFATNVLKQKAILKKDMVLSLDYRKINKSNKRKGIILCLRKDKEKILNDTEIETVLLEIKRKYPNEKIKNVTTVLETNRNINYKEGKKEFNKLIKKYSKAKLIVTDRLHGMIISIITDTPCIAFDNYSGKVKGVYETIKNDNIKVDFRERMNKNV